VPLVNRALPRLHRRRSRPACDAGNPQTPTTCVRSSRPSKGSPDSTACSPKTMRPPRRRRPTTAIRAVMGQLKITTRHREMRNGGRYVQTRRVLEQKTGLRTLVPRPQGRVKDRASGGEESFTPSKPNRNRNFRSRFDTPYPHSCDTDANGWRRRGTRKHGPRRPGACGRDCRPERGTGR